MPAQTTMHPQQRY